MEEKKNYDVYDTTIRTVTITLAEYRDLVAEKGKLDEMNSTRWRVDAAREKETKAREQFIEALRAQVEEQATRIATLEQALAEITDDRARFNDALREIGDKAAEDMKGKAESEAESEGETW